MRITIDLDDVNKGKALRKKALMQAIFNNSEIRPSCGGKGFHLISRGLTDNINDILLMRYWIGDDRRRLIKDYERDKMGICCNVLFSKKTTIRVMIP